MFDFKIVRKEKTDNKKELIEDEKEKVEDKKVKEKKKQVSSKVTDLLPFLDITKTYILQKDEVMDIIEIEGKDILSLTQNELERDIKCDMLLIEKISR